jgi:thiosulfate dehydrogenase
VKSLHRVLAVSAVVLFVVASSSPRARQNSPQTSDASPVWTAPSPDTIPAGPLGDSIRLGLKVFDETPKYAAPYVGNKLNCSDCHLKSGTQSYASPMVGVPGLFPMYRDREKTVVTLEERLEQCFQRSENGHRLPENSPEMVGLLSYMQWLSKDQPTGRPFPGRGFETLPALTGDVDRGSQIYAAQCALCHGQDGAGQPPTFPPVWGPGAFNDGAGMNDPSRMAAFVHRNMPQTSPGSLTPQQAYDVSAYIHSKPHTRFDINEHK